MSQKTNYYDKDPIWLQLTFQRHKKTENESLQEI